MGARKPAGEARKGRQLPSGDEGEAAAPRQPTGVAFFDFDNTLIDGDAGPLFGRSLYAARRAQGTRLVRAGLFLRHVPYVSSMAVQAGLYKVRARRRSNLVRSAYKGLRGLRTEDFYSAMKDFVDHEVRRRIYPELVRHIRDHLAAGRRCVVVTTGMEPLVERALVHFPKGVEVIGCTLHERKGRLTGHVDGPLFGVDKANIVKAYCKALRIEPGDCWAYSDHWSDKHMLEAVGHPVTVNPRGPLLRLARKMGWQILTPKAHPTD